VTVVVVVIRLSSTLNVAGNEEKAISGEEGTK
jgi:hypothetical protein